MFTILAGFILIFAFTSIITVLLWVVCGKIFKIDNLTFRKAFVTFLLILLVSLIFGIVESIEKKLVYHCFKEILLLFFLSGTELGIP